MKSVRARLAQCLVNMKVRDNVFHSFIFSTGKCFILIRIIVDLESVPGTLGMMQKCSLDRLCILGGKRSPLHHRAYLTRMKMLG